MPQKHGRSHPEQILFKEFSHSPQVADHIIALVAVQVDSFSEVAKDQTIRKIFEMDNVLSCKANFFKCFKHLLKWVTGMTASDLRMLGPFEQMIVNLSRDFNASLLCHRLDEMPTVAMRHMSPLVASSRLNSVCSFSEGGNKFDGRFCHDGRTD